MISDWQIIWLTLQGTFIFISTAFTSMILIMVFSGASGPGIMNCFPALIIGVFCARNFIMWGIEYLNLYVNSEGNK